MVSSATNGEKDGGSGQQADPSRAGRNRGSVRFLLRDVQALYAYSLHYLAARTDSIVMRARKILLWVILGCVMLAVGVTALLVAVALVLAGIADGISTLLGGQYWAGALITGVGVLAFFAIVAAVAAWAWIGGSANKTREKYQRRREQQRAAFGEDISQRARPFE
jgi:hypothetical protein